MKNYSIGIDLGVNNVGWAIFDNNKNELIKFGVRNFTVSNGASDRRNARNVRRRLKRKDTRIKDILKSLKEINFPFSITIDEKLIEKRYKGIKEKIKKQDITNILSYMVSHRGYIPFGDEEVNFVDLKGKLPCEYYYELYKKNGKYRAMNETVKNIENIEEIKKMLNIQKKYYSEITENFIENIILIFIRKRKFWEGPGGLKQLTSFGRFKTEEDVLNYKKEKELNPNYEKYIFEDLIKTCDIAIDEKCAPKLNFYSEYFNFLNDFINISFKDIEQIDNKSLIKDEEGIFKLNLNGLQNIKKYLIENYDKKIDIKKIFKEIIGTSIENVLGYRIDKDNKPEFSMFNSYRKTLRYFADSNNEWIFNIEDYNRVIYNLTIAPGSEEAIKMVLKDNKISYKFKNEDLKNLSRLFKSFKAESLLSYHSLSEKVLKRALKDMEKYLMNFMQIRKKLDYDKEAREYFQKNYTNSLKLNITNKYIDNIIASPQVKKTLRQAIKIINAIIDDQKELPKTISIESTVELNGNKKKAKIIKEQKRQEELKKAAKEYIIKNFGEDQVNNKNVEKIMLYNEVNGQCAYCDKIILPNDLLKIGYEVEHILPYTKSFDNSFDNKTIACRKCNADKGNKTPYQYIRGYFDTFKEKIEKLDISDKKRNNFLFEDDIDKYTTRFFNRNLRDTAYATKELVRQINLFNYYLEAILNDTRINTLSVSGQIIHNIRDDYELKKDRENGNYHHAVDASILASITNTDFGKIMIKSQNDAKFWLNAKKNIKSNINKFENIKLNNIKEIKEINMDNILSSYQISKNPQQKLFKTVDIKRVIKKENQFYKIEQIDNIYDAKIDMEKLEQLFFEPKKNYTLLCYDKNKKQFEFLKKIYIDGKKEKGNPFINYCIEKNGIENSKEFNYLIHGIKYSKKSPIIKSLRYYTIINDPYFLEKKNINKKENTKIALDRLAQYCTRVYVDIDKNKFLFLPVYSISVDLRTKQIKEQDKLYKKLKDKYVGDTNVEHQIDLFNGDFIEIIKPNNLILTGIYQGFHKTNNKICLKNENYFTRSDIGLKVYSFDVLGKKYLRLTKILD